MSKVMNTAVGMVMLAVLSVRVGHAQAAEQILREFAADYVQDPMAIDAEFGVRVGDDWWSVSVRRAQEAYSPREKFVFHRLGGHSVEIRAGAPRTPTWYFALSDESVLRKLHDGTLSAGTASARSFASDKPMLTAEAMEGFQLDPGAVARMYHTQSHFWARGTPEITRFAREASLPTHGAAMVALYGMKDKRVGWFSIGPEQTANEDVRLRAGQVPNLFIFTKGRGRATFGDEQIEVEAGMAVFIAPYVKHVIANPYDEPLEGVIVLFGDNGDFYRGTSYLDFAEDLYDYYGAYDFTPVTPPQATSP